MKRKRSVKRASARTAGRNSKRASGLSPANNSGALRVADNLVGVAVWYTFLTSLILFFSLIINPAYVLSNFAKAGFNATQSSLSMLSIGWMFLAWFTSISNRFAKAKLDRHQIAGLFLLGLLALYTGRPEAATLTIIAALIYFIKSKRK